MSYGPARQREFSSLSLFFVKDEEEDEKDDEEEEAEEKEEELKSYHVPEVCERDDSVGDGRGFTCATSGSTGAALLGLASAASVHLRFFSLPKGSKAVTTTARRPIVGNCHYRHDNYNALLLRHMHTCAASNCAVWQSTRHSS
jgi:hypothetical protein